MHLKKLVLTVLLFGALVPANTYSDALTMRVLRLSYRPLAEVLPLLQPLVPEPGTITGIGDRLVVKTTPDNLREIQRVLAEKRQRRPVLLVTQVGARLVLAPFAEVVLPPGGDERLVADVGDLRLKLPVPAELRGVQCLWRWGGHRPRNV